MMLSYFILLFIVLTILNVITKNFRLIKVFGVTMSLFEKAV